jgi:hypothetical protein
MTGYIFNTPFTGEEYSTCLLDIGKVLHTFHTSCKYLFIPLLNVCKIVKQMSETFEVRKVLTQGADHLSHSVVIPHKFLAEMKIMKGDYLKLQMEDNRIWMEKLTK